jgi:hypothetical protein
MVVFKDLFGVLLNVVVVLSNSEGLSWCIVNSRDRAEFSEEKSPILFDMH